MRSYVYEPAMNADQKGGWTAEHGYHEFISMLITNKCGNIVWVWVWGRFVGCYHQTSHNQHRMVAP